MSSSSSPSAMPASAASDPMRVINDILNNTGYYQPQPPSTFVVAPQVIVAPQVPVPITTAATAAQAPVIAAATTTTTAAQSPVMAAVTTAAQTTVAPGPAGAPHGWSLTTGGLTIVVVVLALALVALIGCMGMRWCCKRRRQQREKAAAAAATKVVVDIEAQTPAAIAAATKVVVDIESQTPVGGVAC